MFSVPHFLRLFFGGCGIKRVRYLLFSLWREIWTKSAQSQTLLPVESLWNYVVSFPSALSKLIQIWRQDLLRRAMGADSPISPVPHADPIGCLSGVSVLPTVCKRQDWRVGEHGRLQPLNAWHHENVKGHLHPLLHLQFPFKRSNAISETVQAIVGDS